MTKNALRKLRDKQPKDYRQKISETIGCTPEYVDMVFRGDRNNQQIIDMAIDLAEQYQQHLKKQEERINAL